jgi:hypothetical protein
MNKKWKIVLLAPLVIFGLFVFVVVGYTAWGITHLHPDPIFNIGNNFDKPVTVYFEGQKMGKINAGQSKIFYPNEVLNTTNSDLLVELKSNSGEILFTRLYTWDGLTAVLKSVHGTPYWIGEET